MELIIKYLTKKTIEEKEKEVLIMKNTFTFEQKKEAYPYVSTFKSANYANFAHQPSMDKFMSMPEEIFYLGAWTETVHDLVKDDVAADEVIFLLEQYYGEVLTASEIVEILSASQH